MTFASQCGQVIVAPAWDSSMPMSQPQSHCISFVGPRRAQGSQFRQYPFLFSSFVTGCRHLGHRNGINARNAKPKAPKTPPATNHAKKLRCFRVESHPVGIAQINQRTPKKTRYSISPLHANRRLSRLVCSRIPVAIGKSTAERSKVEGSAKDRMGQGRVGYQPTVVVVGTGVEPVTPDS